MTNQQFCYWLQGYFEISEHPLLTREKIQVIENTLSKIEEPLGDYTSWLQMTVSAILENNYVQPLIGRFSELIQSELAAIFLHVIDDSYDTPHSKEYLQTIHDGKNQDIPK